jgi:ABC-2 type transport system ATP-binding protein
MLSVRDLSLFRHATAVLSNVNLEVKRGEVVGLLGPNGSGKSALLDVIAGGYEHFEGEVKLGSYSIKKDRDQAKMKLGFAGSDPVFEDHLTGLEWLEFVGTAYRMAPEARIQAILRLAERFDCKTQLYSTIQRLNSASRQKIALIASLLHQPPVLIWDDPTRYLDPAQQQELMALVKEAAKDGTAALIATPNLWWIEQIADRYIVVSQGEVIAEGTASQLRNQSDAPQKDLATIYRSLFNE